MKKIKPYQETHQQGFMSIENIPVDIENLTATAIRCDFGIQIAEDGRIWICIDGIAFIRFRPTLIKEAK